MKYYTSQHEWFEATERESIWRVGITNFAQDQLGDVVNVELPPQDSAIAVNDACAVVESVKSASDINAPLTGTVSAINVNLANDPALINSGAEGEGWLFEVEVAGEPDTTTSMSEQDYNTAYPIN